MITINNWKQFSDATIAIHDLDPTYDILAGVRKGEGVEFTSRACLYMLMFYDLKGSLETASLKGKKFWEFIRTNYQTLPRGTERRHFRGAAGLKCLDYLEHGWQTNPHDYLLKLHHSDLHTLCQRLSSCPSFGPYMRWKAADYYDRILGLPVDFGTFINHVPEQPLAAAAIFWPNQPLSAVMRTIADYIKTWDAPGLATRKCSFAEAETILCMMKSYFHSKHAGIGDDISLRHGQLGATKWAKYLPPLPTEIYQRGEYVHV